ncbi:MAG: hypothetical protein AAGG48_14875 [Planctomycetota bacterium]
MLGEYKVGRCTRVCHAQSRPLREGEWYYSVVIEDDESFVRHDYSAESWSEPPEGAIGWWKSRMPSSDEKKLVLAPPEVLIDLLRQMESIPTRAKSRYLLALMLMRRKLLRPSSDATPSSDVLSLEVISDGSQIDVPVCEITRSEADTLREELNDLLYCEAEPAGMDDDPAEGAE